MSAAELRRVFKERGIPHSVGRDGQIHVPVHGGEHRMVISPPGVVHPTDWNFQARRGSYDPGAPPLFDLARNSVRDPMGKPFSRSIPGVKAEDVPDIVRNLSAHPVVTRDHGISAAGAYAYGEWNESIGHGQMPAMERPTPAGNSGSELLTRLRNLSAQQFKGQP